jgi:uncharacterized protein
MQHKAFSLIEAKADDDTGTFEALVSVFGNVDQAGDRMMPGSFAKTLQQWEQSGDPIPVILSHQWNDVFAHIGVVEKAHETPRGLFVKGRLDIEDNDVARQVHKLMKRRSLKEFSFGYKVPKGGQKRAKDGANEVYEVELAEVGPTLKGMNPNTELHAVKSALGVPEGEELREQSRQLEREIADLAIPEVKAEPDAPVTDPEADLVKELQEVKDRLATLEAQVADFKKKADETDKAPVARSVDPLRKRSDELALEIASQGVDVSVPPTQVADQERVDPDALKQRSRDLMFEVLNHVTE